MTSKTVKVPNISCGHCVMIIEREVKDLGGVSQVKADQASQEVSVSWDPQATDWAAIEGLLKEINYPPAD